MSINVDNAQGLQWKRNGVVIPSAVLTSYNIPSLGTPTEGNYVVEVTGKAPCKNLVSDTAKILMKSGATNAFLSDVSNYNAIEQCTDVEGWTYYAPLGEYDKFIFAIRKNGNDMTGKADVVIRPNVYENISNSTQGYNGTLMLKRFWNYKLASGEFKDPIDVKFYYDLNEIDALDAKKTIVSDLYGTEIQFEKNLIRWFKTTEVPFTNTLFTNDIMGNKFTFAIKDLEDIDKGVENNLNYIVFNGVTEVGGGTGMYNFKGEPRIIGSIKDGSDFSTNIYPNPTDGIFKLEVISKQLGTLEIEIYNSLGQKVFENSKFINSNEMTIPMDVSELANGLYQVKLNIGINTQLLKLQIEK